MVAKSIILCALLAATFAAPAEVSTDLLEHPEGRISNGEVAILGQFPHQAFLDLYVTPVSRRKCGGSLIHKNWILTAAKCTYDADYVDLYLGTVDKSDCPAETCVKVYSNNLTTHGLYKPGRIGYDIALIALDEEVEISDYIKPVMVALTPPQNGSIVTSSGFGNNKDLSDKLHWVTNPVLRLENDEENILIDTTGGKGICYGDSGGPLNSLEDMSDPDGIIYGIASYINGDTCESGEPHGFINVVHYLEWISENSGLTIDKFTTLVE